MSKTELKVMLPPEVASEIAQVATSAQRSTAFIALRALLAAPKDAVGSTEGTVGFALNLDEDDPATTLTKIKSAAGKRPLDAAVAGAWTHTRQRFSQWMEKQTVARQAEDADDLDQALAQAKDPNASPSTLSELARSEYPRVRALVAAHPRTDAAALAKLAQDREPYVRAAVEKRGAA